MISEAVLTTILSVLGGINLLELIGFILFYKLNKRSKELDNAGKGVENFDKYVETMDKIVNNLEDKFNDSEEDSKAKALKIDELITEKMQLMKEKTELELLLTKAQFMKCEVKGCPKRIPPTGF